MTEQEFVALVERLEAYSHEQPELYKSRVALLAVLGYVVLFGAMGAPFFLAIVAIEAYHIEFRLIELLILFGFVVVVLRSLSIKFPAPEGEELEYEDAPKLFELTKKIRAATKGPRVHKVLVTGEYNAGIVQCPRLGLLGWPKNYLIVGLPLMEALSPTDVRAVLTHEFGHLSGEHGKFRTWVYGARLMWIQALTELKLQRRYSIGLLERFFKWYAPYFNAYSFVLARTHEYEADQCSARLVGKQAAGRALIKSCLKERAIGEAFLPELFKRADNEPRPPDNVFTELLKAIREPVAKDKQQLWFSQELTRRHEYHDTHPALGDRLAALGLSDICRNGALNEFQKEEGTESGREHFLVRQPKLLINRKNRAWEERVNKDWLDRYRYVREAERLLVAINERAQSIRLTIEEAWERARCVAVTPETGAAIPYLKDVLQLLPDHAAANQMLGELLLRQQDETGIQHLEACMEKDETSTPPCCELIYSFLMSGDREAEAKIYRERADKYYDEVNLAKQERNAINNTDDFSSHGVDREALAALRLQLGRYPSLGSAYLVRKIVKHFPDIPCLVLAVTAKHQWHYSNNQRDRACMELVTQLLQLGFPKSLLIIPLNKKYKPLQRKFQLIAGSEIYRA